MVEKSNGKSSTFDLIICLISVLILQFSASPGRYALTDIQTLDSGKQSIEITSTYPWGSHVIETILLDPNGHESLTKDQLLVRNLCKLILACYVLYVNSIHRLKMVGNAVKLIALVV